MALRVAHSDHQPVSAKEHLPPPSPKRVPTLSPWIARCVPSVGGDVHPRTRRDAFQETNRAIHTDHLAATGTPVPQTASTRTHRRRESLGAAVELEDAAEPSRAATPPTETHQTWHRSPLHHLSQDGASKEGTTPMAPPPSNPSGFWAFTRDRGRR
jgi:hypothetical protein